ncbi:MAG: ATP-binding protein [Armatimonadota bacterium]
MANLPTATVTFVFTDIERSTRLLQQLGDRYAAILADHNRLLRGAFHKYGGQELETHGDGLLFAFPTARAAVEASVDAQRLVLAHPWPDGASVRVRIGVHTGEPISGETGYVGIGLHRAARICAAGHGGQTLLSQTTRDLLEDDPLDTIRLRDLGQHRLKDLQHPEHLFQVVVAGLPEDFPRLRTPEAYPNNLPQFLSSFVGRAREISEVKDRLPTTRLLTLTGPGGSGKTRLALRTAVEVLDEFPEGVWLVELAPLTDPDQVAQTVATALGIREEPGRPIQTTLVDSLRHKRLLLLLDNCEHLLSACARLADTLLQNCSHMRILATSQEALGIGGESVWLVPFLSLPDVSGSISVERLLQSEAGSLFNERARAARRSFTVTAANAPAVAKICRQLEGIPLAIELAAARVKALTVEQIALRLEDSIGLLAGGSRTAASRHQTLQATLDWSYGLLSEPERVLFRRLSVFAGRFALEAAEAVCEDAGELDTFNQVTLLVDKSLLQVEPRGDEARYRLLEPVRLYAIEKLREAGEEAQIRDKHLSWYLELVTSLEESEGIHSLPQETEAAVFAAIPHEYNNIRAAIEWSLTGGDADKGLRLAYSMHLFWISHGHVMEGRDWLKAILQRSRSSSPLLRARALRQLGRLTLQLSEYAAAASFIEEALANFRALGDKYEITRCLWHLGRVARWQGDYLRARALHEESLAAFRELDAKQAIGQLLGGLSQIQLVQGDYDAAEVSAREGLAICREFGRALFLTEALSVSADLFMQLGKRTLARPLFEECLDLAMSNNLSASIVDALAGLGSIARDEGDIPKARSLFEEALRLNKETSLGLRAAGPLRGLASVALLQNDLAEASSLLKSSLRESQAIGQKPGILRCLLEVAQLALQESQQTHAARLLGAAEALRETLGIVMAPANRAEYERDVSNLRVGLGEEAMAQAWAEGRAMTINEAVSYALQDAHRPN